PSPHPSPPKGRGGRALGVQACRSSSGFALGAKLTCERAVLSPRAQAALRTIRLLIPGGVHAAYGYDDPLDSSLRRRPRAGARGLRGGPGLAACARGGGAFFGEGRGPAGREGFRRRAPHRRLGRAF